MFGNLLKQLGIGLSGDSYQKSSRSGLRQIAKATSEQAQPLQAATKVANAFLSALWFNTYSLAGKFCTSSLLKDVKDSGDFVSCFPLDLASWKFTSFDDSAESNSFGAIVSLDLVGDLRYTNGVSERLKLRLQRHGDSWKIVGWFFNRG